MPFTFYLHVLLLAFIVSCTSTAKEQLPSESIPLKPDTSVVKKAVKIDRYAAFKTKDSIEYSKVLSNIAQAKVQLVNGYNSGKVSMDSVEQFFIHQLVRKIIPYWYGTPWTFEGHTNIPNEGEVACGYFVTTTLKHLGTNVNRYKMAQQASLTGLKMVSPSSEIAHFVNDSFGAAANKIAATMKHGVYMAGFDYHVGYLLIDANGLHFIHSSNYEPVEVTIEDAHISEAFNYSNNVYLANIGKPYFLKKWMNKTRIVVPE